MKAGTVEAALTDHIRRTVAARGPRTRVRGRSRAGSYRITVESLVPDKHGRPTGQVGQVIVDANNLLLRTMEDDGFTSTEPVCVASEAVPLSDPDAMDRLDRFLAGLGLGPAGKRRPPPHRGGALPELGVGGRTDTPAAAAIGRRPPAAGLDRTSEPAGGAGCGVAVLVAEVAAVSLILVLYWLGWR